MVIVVVAIVREGAMVETTRVVEAARVVETARAVEAVLVGKDKRTTLRPLGMTVNKRNKLTESYANQPRRTSGRREPLMMVVLLELFGNVIQLYVPHPFYPF